MARILLAWELGANLGHLMPLRRLAQAFRTLGHDCLFAARDLAAAEEALEPELGPVLQAPLRAGTARNLVRTQVSYASLLNNSGFDDVTGLAGRVRAWRTLLQQQGASMLVADHAPTAALAARTLDLPVLALGTGFTVPPLTAPFPVFRPDAVVSDVILLHNESAVLGNINAALARLQLPALPRLQGLYENALSRVMSYPELDHYEVARREPYCGVPDSAYGGPPPWPNAVGPKILGYLRGGKTLNTVLEALQRSSACVLVRVGDASAARLRQYERPGMHIVEAPLDMRAAARDCDAFVSYASHGMAAELLLAGKPGLLLPDTLERELVARRVKQLGAALVPGSGDFNLSAALRQLIDDPAPRAAAASFSARHAAQDRTQILPRIAAEALAHFNLR